ncbi:MAG TPA: prepilin-type N-terminal cleavage/methylation domain-containing protein [Candidatus Saccharimonadales bacterium]|nr:prepilin-type N-terminal cleavage/methylation domain-containing protein [Candidatus Saccharimonadales bacterium]
MSVNNLSVVRQQHGFTIVELAIVISVTSIVAVVFLGIITNYFVTITRNNELTDMTINSQNLLRTTVQNIRFGNGVEQSNTITDPNAPSGGWNTNNSAFVIVIPVPAEDSSKNYIIDPDTGSPYMNELVYYKNGNTLMERVLANPNAVGNTTVTTCPSSSSSTSCPPDKLLATYVSSMTFTLYDQNAAVTTTPTSARSVNISLTMQRNAPVSPLSLTDSIRVTLRNRF